MKVSFICPVFPPEPEPAGIMARQLAQRLAGDGHSVTVIAPVPNRPKGKVYAGHGRFGSIETADGVRVVRCPHWLIGPRRRNLDRVLENVSFGISSSLAALREPRPDILIVETWPLIAAHLPITLSNLLRVPAIYYVQDVYPESLERTGLIRECGAVSRWLRQWDGYLCRRAATVVAISETMRSLLRANRSIPAEHIEVIPNWIDDAEFNASGDGPRWRREVGIDQSAFVALYAGTLGHVSGVEVLVDVAQRLARRPDVLLVCVGEGIKKAEMIARAGALGLSNIKFLEFQPRERLLDLQCAADAMLLTMRAGYPDASVPSKLITYMAAGRPIICSVPAGGAAAQTVAAANAGRVVPAGDSGAIAAAIEALAADPGGASELGSNGRCYFKRHLTLDRAHAQFRDLISRVAGNA